MRVEALTIFRFIAALIVVAQHFGLNNSFVKLAPNILGAGSEFVTFFFVLSGFVLMLNYFDKDKFSTKRYWLHRIFKIVPAYLFALSLMILYLPPKDPVAFIGVFTSILFLQAWIPPYAVFLNIPAWAISVQMFFYSIFPKINNKLKQNIIDPKKLLIYAFVFWGLTQLILILLFNSSIYKDPNFYLTNIIKFFPLSHLCSFLLGIAAGYFVLKNKEKFIIPKYYGYTFFTLTMLFILIFFEYKYSFTNSTGIFLPIKSSFFAPLFVLLIFSVITIKGTLLDKILTFKPFMILGKASYAFYIFQWPIAVLYNKYFFNNLNFTDNDKNFYFYILILTIFSILYFYGIENTTKKLIKKWELKKYGYHH